MFIRFDVIHERDRWTDGRTDGQTDRQTLLDSKDRAYASHRAAKIAGNAAYCVDCPKVQEN